MDERPACSWNILDSTFILDLVPEPLIQELAPLLAGFRMDSPDARGRPPRRVRVQVEGAPGSQGRVLFQEGETVDEAPLEVVGASSLEYTLVRRAVESVHGLLVLHAAALQHPGGITLLLGDSGAGKTTLALLLRVAGLRLLSDDLSPLDPGSLRVVPFPRAPHLDGEHPVEVWASLPAGEWCPTQRVPFPPHPRPSEPPDVAGDGYQVRQILVLGRCGRGEDRVEEVPGAEAVQCLLRSVIRSGTAGLATLLPVLADVGRGARAFRIFSSSPSSARDAALELVRAAVRSNGDPGEAAPAGRRPPGSPRAGRPF